MILARNNPNDQEFPLYGISIDVEISFEAITAPFSEELKLSLSDPSIYTSMKPALVSFADSTIDTWFGHRPQRSYQVEPPHGIWDNDDDEFVESKLTPLMLLGLEFHIRMFDKHYELLIEMVESDCFCGGCETIVGDGVNKRIAELNWNGPIKVKALVEGFGAG